MSQRRRLDVKPSKEELEAVNTLNQPKQTSSKMPMIGFGVPREFEPPKPPEKPADLPVDVAEWVEEVDNA